MKRFSFGNISIICLLALMLALGAGCQNDPVKGEEDSEDIEWPDLTAPDDVIETIRLVYQNYDKGSDELISHYAAILYDDPNQNYDYVWNMQTWDVAEYGDRMLREEDIAGTTYIIENCSALTLTIWPGSWESADDVCEECQRTTRTYSISATMFYYGELNTFNGDELRIEFVVGPNEQVPGTWAIYIASDLPSI